LPPGIILKTTSGDLILEAGVAFRLNANGAGDQLYCDDGDFFIGDGLILSSPGTGNINLPNNANARFKIESVAVGATVTAPALNTLTSGANADALHVHAGLGTSAVDWPGVSGEALAAGVVVALDDSGGVPRVFRADANGAGERVNGVGFNISAVGASGLAVSVRLAGEIAVADALWDAVPTTAQVGRRVYMSETVGNVTLTAPALPGSMVLRVGIVSVGGAGVTRLIIQIGEGEVV
jgi:hypothetical protein